MHFLVVLLLAHLVAGGGAVNESQHISSTECAINLTSTQLFTAERAHVLVVENDTLCDEETGRMATTDSTRNQLQSALPVTLELCDEETGRMATTDYTWNQLQAVELPVTLLPIDNGSSILPIGHHDPVSPILSLALTFSLALTLSLSLSLTLTLDPHPHPRRHVTLTLTSPSPRTLTRTRNKVSGIDVRGENAGRTVVLEPKPALDLPSTHKPKVLSIDHDTVSPAKPTLPPPPPSTRLYAPLRASTRLYAPLRASTRLYAPLRASTRLYAPLRASTRLYAPLAPLRAA